MKFIVSHELGRLARWLRILGFDAAYFTSADRTKLTMLSLKEDRIILTRDTRLSRYAGYRTLRVDSDLFKEQVSQVLKGLNLEIDEDKLFTRCIVCNQELQETDKQEIKSKVPEYVFQTQESFKICPKCKRIYWQGTHWGNVRKVLKEVYG